MNRTIGAASVALLLAIGGVATAAPAFADDAPAPIEEAIGEAPATDPVAEPEPEPVTEALVIEQTPELATVEPVENCIGVSWQKPQGGAFGPQYVVLSGVTPSTPCTELTIDDVAEVTCVGQGDIYADDATTAALIAGGYLLSPGNPAESWPSGGYKGDGVSSKTWDHGDCIEQTQCPAPSTLATATNLNPLGWALTNGEWVDGGIKLTASNWSDAYAEKATSFPLSQAANLAVDVLGFDPGASNEVWAIILVTAGGNVHYEPTPYTDPLWANFAGVLPANGGGQGGPFSGDLDDLQSDPTVTSVLVYFSTGSATAQDATFGSASFNCTTQPFDYEKPADPPVDEPTPPTSVKAGDEPVSPLLPVAFALLLAVAAAAGGRRWIAQQ